MQNSCNDDAHHPSCTQLVLHLLHNTNQLAMFPARPLPISN